MKRFFCLTTLVLLASVAAFADIARPDPTKTPKPAKGVNTTMSIRLDRNATEVKLIIPKSQIKQLRAELEQLDDDESDNTAAVTQPSSFSRTQTIVSGAFLSLALVFGGMWFVRSGKAASKEGKALIALAVLTGIGSAATFVYADIAPPQLENDITSKIFNQNAMWRGEATSWNVRIESTNGDKIELYVPDPPAPGSPASNVNK